MLVPSSALARMTRTMYKLTEEGRKQFPHLASKVFFVQTNPLTKDYVKARAVGQVTWSVYAARFFRRVHGRRTDE